MSDSGEIYDISDVKVDKGVGTVTAKFLPNILPVFKGLAKNLLGGLAIGEASEGASQAVKTIAGKKGGGTLLKLAFNDLRNNTNFQRRPLV